MKSLKRWRESENIQAKELVQIVKTLYPKYDKSLMSKVENDLCGVRLKSDAQALLTEVLGIPAHVFEDGAEMPEKSEKVRSRAFTPKICFRLDLDVSRRLHSALKQDGKTIQGFFETYVRQYLKRKEKSAHEAAASKGAQEKDIKYKIAETERKVNGALKRDRR